MTIGQFATAAQLSIKALRVYHQQGLLSPAYVDPYNNYRYYLTGQLHLARLIRVLRGMEMPLAEVRQALAVADTNPQHAQTIVLRYLEKLENRLEAARRVANQFDTMLNNKESIPMAFEVKPIQLKGQSVVSVSGRVRVKKLDAFIRESLAQIRQYVVEQGGKLAGAPFGIYHGPINDEDDGPIQVCCSFTGTVKPAGKIEVTELQGGSFAMVELHGADCDFPAILGGYDAVCTWIAQRGYDMIGSPREVWVSHAGDPEVVMQIAWQYQEK